MNTDNKVVGLKIKKYRNNKRITQKELGNLVGKSEITIRKYESGNIQVPNDVLRAIANALDVSIIELMDLSNQEDTINKENAFISYLKSIGYSVNFDNEVLEWHHEDVIEDGKVIGKAQIADKETYTATIINDKFSVTLTESEFKDLKNNINKAIEFEIFKANQNN